MEVYRYSFDEDGALKEGGGGFSGNNNKLNVPRFTTRSNCKSYVIALLYASCA